MKLMKIYEIEKIKKKQYKHVTFLNGGEISYKKVGNGCHRDRVNDKEWDIGIFL